MYFTVNSRILSEYYNVIRSYTRITWMVINIIEIIHNNYGDLHHCFSCIKIVFIIQLHNITALPI